MLKDRGTAERDLRFSRACVAALGYEPKSSIGTYSERSVHRVLKFYIEPDEAFHEIKFQGSVADIKNEDGITEIQTKAYGRLKDKLERFLPGSRVTVVCPIIAKKYIRYIDNDTGELTPRRSSPKRATAFDLAYELYNIREFLTDKNLSLKLIFLEAEQIKQRDVRVKVAGRYRSRLRLETVPLSVIDERDLRTADDYRIFIPEALPESFTVSDFNRAVGRRFSYGYSVISILLSVGLVRGPETVGRNKLYHLI